MLKIQVFVIVINFLFLLYTSRLIVKGKLREEYSFVWWVIAGILFIFSIWSDGLVMFSRWMGFELPSNLVFSGLIFIILIYLLHLSIVNSRLQKNVTKLTQEVAILKQKLESEN